jgi:hypothetical protein
MWTLRGDVTCSSSMNKGKRKGRGVDVPAPYLAKIISSSPTH